MGRSRQGATPKDVVWASDRAELWRYHGGPIRYDPPVVFVHSLVSRSYILDLRPGSSTVEFLLNEGFDVTCSTGASRTSATRTTTSRRTSTSTCPRAIEAVRRETGRTR